MRCICECAGDDRSILRSKSSYQSVNKCSDLTYYIEFDCTWYGHRGMRRCGHGSPIKFNYLLLQMKFLIKFILESKNIWRNWFGNWPGEGITRSEFKWSQMDLVNKVIFPLPPSTADTLHLASIASLCVESDVKHIACAHMALSCEVVTSVPRGITWATRTTSMRAHTRRQCNVFNWQCCYYCRTNKCTRTSLTLCCEHNMQIIAGQVPVRVPGNAGML